MKREYDFRNKRNLVIILVLAIIIIIIFSLFIYKYKHTKTIEYKVNTGSILQDNHKKYINIEEDGLLKLRWNDNYYLKYQKKKTNLGKNVIVYDPISNKLKLYGKFYEIDANGKINMLRGETSINNTSDTKFYKMADREYLLVDKQIVSADRSISADNYLLVELDKMGNAKLTNNKLNLKTISPTTLVTSKYTFDIANEILKYGELEIDLKKIIGSSNEYVAPPDDGKGEGTETQENQEQNNQVADGGGNGGEDVVVEIPKDPLEGVTVEELKSKVKMSSIVNYQVGLTSADVDYIVYDPYNEYKAVYALIDKGDKVERVALSKTESHVVINELKPGTNYKLTFMYTIIDYETGESKDNQFDEISFTTKKPVYSGKITGIYPFLDKVMTYSIDLDTGYRISNLSATVTYYCQEEEEVVRKTKSVSHNITGSEKKVNGSISISDCKIVINGTEKVTINEVTGSSGVITFD